MKKGILGLVAIFVVIAILGVTALSGLNLGITRIPSAAESIVLGLDLQGGASIIYEASPEDGAAVVESDMAAAQEVLRRRLDGAGLTEATVQIMGEDRLSVEIPGKDASEAIATLGQTAVLEFRDADGNVILNGDDVKAARAQFAKTKDIGPAEHHVVLDFTAEGRRKFADATGAAISKEEGKRFIAAYLDETIILNASVKERIDSESCIVTFGNGTTAEAGEEAEVIANLINSGRLPFELIEIQSSTVGPTLGDKALETSLLAAAIGLLLVMAFMIIFYRVPGIVAAISLAFYTALMAVVLGWFNVNLSLPGIAGIILSIGMAVDANVIIYERIKEELRVGKTITAAIDSGFKRAFWAIFDSNITTLIAAVVLYNFGVGTVRGFAVTFGVGVVLSMFTVLVVSRFLLYRLVDLKIKSPKAYGA